MADNGVTHVNDTGIISGIILHGFPVQRKHCCTPADHLHEKPLKQLTDQRGFFEKPDPFVHIQIGSMGKDIADSPGTHQAHRSECLRRMDIVDIFFSGRNQMTVFPQPLHIFQTQRFFYIPKVYLSPHHGEEGKVSSCRFNFLYPAHLSRITGNPCKQNILTALRICFRKKAQEIFDAGHLPSHRVIPEIAGIIQNQPVHTSSIIPNSFRVIPSPQG